MSAILLLFAIGACDKGEPSSSCVPILKRWSSSIDAIRRQGVQVEGPVTSVVLTDDDILWNGQQLDEAQLRFYLKELEAKNAKLVVAFDPQTADCGRARHIRDLIDLDYRCGEGLCGQGDRAAFAPLIH